MQTNNSSYLRRGGLLYVKTEFFLQTDFYKRGYISKVELCRNIFIRNIVRVMPNSMRKLIYKKKMRESVEVKSTI